MFSKTAEYGIKAMLYVARKSKGDARAGVKEIAAAIDAPMPFTAKILQELSRMDLIRSLKGPNGGFYLEGRDFRISIGRIVQALDGDKLFTGCALGLSECSASRPCPLHHEFVKIRQDISDTLNRSRIGDCSAALEQELTFLKH
ncbi:RrF2 family transcriptional regulator [Flavihumibacter petaseus]|uniref:Putative Rrf2 family transcriptional regulator n=1 Tax=Flavihumibacter petaseus NBRC 106054 TaxID=1220578 RepID=A0A0E9MZI4_9BACT|nr:Rrf2 family transcriptional regulator [Flavihumibacter petaseus]GAO42999.1 putative Rrf2 family transcriptional regulator [Flavihumibacter petaseus NBRC 106054]